MFFNPGITKQAPDVIFSCKNRKSGTSHCLFNEAPVAHTPSQKHLGMHIYLKLNFNIHINKKLAKATKGVAIIPKLACVLPRESLITIYNSFVRPYIDYGDITYDQPNNDSFCNMTEKVQ